ncbi:Chlorovirus glycoprotein repeat domain-containing protein [Acanthocystis turfacea Chlorella virus NTS-1]|nr:Chlorovirus glycoprotein repeat domain-containing protein [Acanthocystis turfacea Chlorella virus NTS-1]
MSESASFKNSVKKYAGIDSDAGTIVLKGNATFFGNGSFFESLTVGNLEVTGNAVIPGISFDELTIVGNIATTGGNFIGNGALLTGVTSTLPSAASIDITGNVSGAFVNTTTLGVSGNAAVAGQVNVVGNIVGGYFIGDGSLLAGVGVSGNANINVIGNVFSPGNVDATNVATTNLRVNGNAIVMGQVNVTGNIIGGYFLGNGALLEGVRPTGSANLNIIGNVFSTGNVDAPNVSMNRLMVNGNATVSGEIISTGNVTANLIFGNGYYLTLDGFTMNPQGNVANVEERLALANASIGTLVTQDDVALRFLLTNLPSNVSTNWLEFQGVNFPVMSVFGRTGNVVGANADYSDALVILSANVGMVTTNGYVSEALAYLDAYKATIDNGNISARYFSGNVLSSGNVDATNVSSINLRVGGDARITGQVNVTGGAAGIYFLGNGALLEGVGLTGNANIDIRGNVLSSGNVDATNVSTTNLRVSGNASTIGQVNATGNAVVMGQVNVTGNIIGGHFIGNGALIEGVRPTGSANLNIIGNVFSTGNVDAPNVSTNRLMVNGNATVSGEIISTGNVTANLIFGNGYYLALDGFTMNPQGNVANAVARLALANASIGTLVTQDDIALRFLLTNLPSDVSTNWLEFKGVNFPVMSVFGRTGNVVGANADYSDALVILSANVGMVTTNGYVSEALAYLDAYKATIDNGNISARYFSGNVLSSGNVDATNVTVRNLRVNGNATATGRLSSTGNVVGRYFLGNVLSSGNVDATNVTTITLLVSGNAVATGLSVETDNVIGRYFRGNVVSSGNVDSTNVSTINLRVNGNAVVTGQVNTTGNVAGRYFIGNGFLTTGVFATPPPVGNIDIRGNVISVGNVSANIVIANNMISSGNITAINFVGNGSGLTGLPSAVGATFIFPSTGLTSNTAGAVTYSSSTGWAITLQQNTNRFITVNAYNMPVYPDAPFVGLPANVTQTVTTPWSFAANTKIWSCTVRLSTPITFSSASISLGNNTAFGSFRGNSSAMVISSV